MRGYSDRSQAAILCGSRDVAYVKEFCAVKPPPLQIERHRRQAERLAQFLVDQLAHGCAVPNANGSFNRSGILSRIQRCTRRASETLKIPLSLREVTRRPSRSPAADRERRRAPAPRSAKVTLNRVLITRAKSTRRQRTPPSTARFEPLQLRYCRLAMWSEPWFRPSGHAVAKPGDAFAPAGLFWPGCPLIAKSARFTVLDMAALTMFRNASSRPV
jgi:hypothetical protein